MKRLFDLIFSSLLILIFLPLILLISIMIRITSGSPILFWSKRIGLNNTIFNMPKFRTMHIETKLIETNMLQNLNSHCTSFGKFLRKTSLDELPQLYSILIGEMSFVGPRPALFTQTDLIKLRNKYKINTIKPGLSGLAQINGRNTLSNSNKIKYERIYLRKKSIYLDLKIIIITIYKVLLSKDIIK